MAELPERRVSPMAEWARSVSVFSMVLFATAGLGHRYGLVETYAFIWLLGLIAGLALLGLALAAGGMARLWEHGDKAGKASLAAIVASSIVLAPFAAALYLAVRRPALTDISTDLVEPPRFLRAAGNRSERENAIVPISPEAARAQAESYPEISGRRYEAPIERIAAAVDAVIAARGWKRYPATRASRPAAELAIEVEAPTFGFRFPADAVIRMTDEGGSTFVDMRLNSRYGRHDLGDGARRIRNFMADVDAEFERQSIEIIDIPPSTGEEDPVD